MEQETSKAKSTMSSIATKRVMWSYDLNLSKRARTLKKFYPKYVKKLSFDYFSMKRYDAVPRIRSIKRVSTLNLERSDYSIVPDKALILKIIKKQKRFLKHISGGDRSFYKHVPHLAKLVFNAFDMPSWKIFASHFDFERLKMAMWGDSQDIESNENRVVDKIKWKFLMRIAKLRRLKHFKLEFYVETERIALMLLHALNKSEPFLNHLKTFAIQVDYPQLNCQAFDDLLENIQKYITHLSLGRVSIYSPHGFITHLNHCTRLANLSLDLTDAFPNEDEDINWNMNYLSYIENMNSLRSINLRLKFKNNETLKAFLESFSLPKAIESITLIIELKWEDLIPYDMSTRFKEENLFESQDFYINFVEKWSGLNRLTHLSFSVSDKSRFSALSEYFLIPILRKLTSLEILEYKRLVENSPSVKKIPMNFGQFWDSLESSRLSLHTMIISDSDISFEDFQNQSTKLPILKTLVVNGTLVGCSGFKNFSRCISQEDNKITKDLSALMNQFVIENDESFKNFLEGFLHFPKTFNASISVNVMRVSPDVLLEDFLEFFDSTSMNSSISLQLMFANNLKSREWTRLNKSAFTSKFFKSLIVSTRTGKLVVDTRYLPSDLEDSDEDEEEETQEMQNFQENITNMIFANIGWNGAFDNDAE